MECRSSKGKSELPSAVFLRIYSNNNFFLFIYLRYTNEEISIIILYCCIGNFCILSISKFVNNVYVNKSNLFWSGIQKFGDQTIKTHQTRNRGDSM